MDESIDTITSTLLARAQAHEPRAWAQLVDVYSPLVYRWCLKRGLSPEGAEDVGQDVFLAVYRALGTFEHDSFRGWLRTITDRKCLDFQSRTRRQPDGQGGSDFQEWLSQQPAEESGDAPSHSDEKLQLYTAVLSAVSGEFSKQDVEAFRCLVIDQKTPAEVAEQLAITRNQVYLAKSRIRRRLREVFGTPRNSKDH